MILSLIVLGVIILILGIIFYFQSKSFVGPKRSFMYNNPNWTINGFILILFGVSLVVVGFFTAL
ncbi:MAG TPA: hypothetical protein VHJ57_03170 [Nitrososphaeraceae archaeon]|jgi:uncharacterized membrane protein YidH (DUF202 family)|nr:hypothetical protein [Nitrososphaeraceae archaeon]